MPHPHAVSFESGHHLVVLARCGDRPPGMVGGRPVRKFDGFITSRGESDNMDCLRYSYNPKLKYSTFSCCTSLGVGIATVTDLQLNLLGTILSSLAIATTCVAQIASFVKLLTHGISLRVFIEEMLAYADLKLRKFSIIYCTDFACFKRQFLHLISLHNWLWNPICTNKLEPPFS
ncbi:hypothetical protein Nepgr_021168 [Nepenthes gracilis]|uniref:Uncharacterized protein n=1 Tax=Nepenthes gracilis TaxID=150966 RepID=A0AAD3SYD6_NEPGR|nr:hypothetical protein Nepgr_021168 [Nepenthes gracilis]